MKRLPDLTALLLALITLVAVYQVTTRVYEGVPHIEDEVAYSWQAALYTRNRLAIESPPCPHCFLTPFVVDYNGLRFSKYPPGWPAMLSLGARLNLRDWVNPLLAALCIWLTYRLVSRTTNPVIGLLAAVLTLTSPFFLLNGGTLLSHIWSFFLTLAFWMAWLDITASQPATPRWMSILLGGFSLGLLALTRPLTAVAVAFPFFVEGIIRLFKSPPVVRTSILIMGFVAAVLAGLLFVWQYAVTGDFFLNPYTLWWEYDKIGFGPGIGVQEGGHNLYWARLNLKHSLHSGVSDLFGWGRISWLFLPFGLLALRHHKPLWSTIAIAPSLMLFYMLYWIGAQLYGPRYYFEGLISVALLTAAGIVWLAGKLSADQRFTKNWWLSRIRFAVINAVVIALTACNLWFYLPARLGGMVHLYGASRQQLLPFQSQNVSDLTPALVFVHRQKNWREYATLLELSSPYLDTPFVFVFSRSEEDNQQVIQAFPGRKVWHYYPDEPFRFYASPRP